MKKRALKNNSLKKLEKVTKFFNISKTYKSKERIPSANRVSRCSQNNRQVIIRNETCLKTKTKNCKKKLRKTVPIFAIFCHISQQKK